MTKRYETPEAPGPDMERLGTMTPEQIAKVLDALPNDMTPGDVVEIVVNIMFNYNMQGEELEIAAQIVMAARQQGIVSTVAAEVEVG